MGQCITIEVSSSKSNDAKQINKHHSAHKGLKQHDQHGHKHADGKKLKQDESSDEETSDDGSNVVDREAENNFAMDENFGKQQSPINLVTCSGTPNCYQLMSDADFKNNPLKINYPDEVRGCTIINTGHTVQVNIPDHCKCSLSTNGKIYHLKQFHFHTPSEHMIDSKQYEMEMHLVHVNDKGEIAVLGFIFTTQKPYFQSPQKLTKAREQLVKQTQQIIMTYANGFNDDEDPVHQNVEARETSNDEAEAELETVTPGYSGMNEEERRRSSVRQLQGNDFLDQFWEELPLKKTTEGIRLTNPLSFDYLFESASKTFTKSVETNEIEIDMEIFEYDGSLTTPPYTEGVQWMVCRALHFINAKQLNKLSSCWGHHANARECQHYHGRAVEMRTGASMKGYFFN